MQPIMKKIISHLLAALPLFVINTVHAQQAAKPLAEPGLLLRAGNWDNGVGSYLVSESLAGISPKKWPTQGWARLLQKDSYIDVQLIQAPKNAMPEFLQQITRQVPEPGADSSVAFDNTSDKVNGDNAVYLRVPGAPFKNGRVPIYVFKNGTSSLRPKLDYKYELIFSGMQFAFTVQNGFKAKSGATYGEGAQISIEYGGEQFEYSLGGYGWDAAIIAIGDFDGDGKPDFIFGVGGSNSGAEFVLLSSVAKPGKNAPTASLTSQGC